MDRAQEDLRVCVGRKIKPKDPLGMQHVSS